jgi:hypothetical protein
MMDICLISSSGLDVIELTSFWDNLKFLSIVVVDEVFEDENF